MAGIYVHIPFCGSKCIYCDFYSLARHESDIDAYIDALLVEARLRCSELPPEPIRTLYFGGGTPSLLSAEQFARLYKGIAVVYDLSQLEEVTVEVNPDDVTVSFISTLRTLGVNRISMGIQSFDDGELHLINRRHNSAQAMDAVATIRKAGIQNISIDLIYGIPGQSMVTWKRNVDKALSLDVQHVSAYSMMYEQGTRLWVMREQGKVHEVDEATSVEMYNYLVESLKKAGFVHYEISNFAKPDFYSRHNSSYWDLTPYLGLGAAAHSYDGIVRRYNPAHLNNYLRAIESEAIAFEEENETVDECYDEYVMLRLRTAEGLDIEELTTRFGEKYGEYFLKNAQPFVQKGQITIEHAHYCIPESQVMLTDAITRDLFMGE